MSSATVHWAIGTLVDRLAPEGPLDAQMWPFNGPLVRLMTQFSR